MIKKIDVDINWLKTKIHKRHYNLLEKNDFITNTIFSVVKDLLEFGNMSENIYFLGGLGVGKQVIARKNVSRYIDILISDIFDEIKKFTYGYKLIQKKYKIKSNPYPLNPPNNELDQQFSQYSFNSVQ